jgi:putative intracellular protease/amidase
VAQLKVLVCMTGSATLTLSDGERHPSGYWAEELVVPYRRLQEAGYEVDVATPGGVVPTVDQTSIDPGFMQYVRPADPPVDDAAVAADLRRAIAEIPGLAAPLDADRLTEGQVASYDGIYYTGGHGTMQDMPKSDGLSRVARWALAADKPIGAVCHGSCGMLNVRTPEGSWPFEGYRMTCFAHAEERQTPIAGKLPFVLEEEIRRLGARYESADQPWGSHVVVDRNLVTGQNPHSSTAFAEAFVRQLSRQPAPA